MSSAAQSGREAQAREVHDPNTRRGRGSDTATHGVRVKSEPQYLPEHSEPGERRYVFGYKITISNEGTRRVRLLSRHWKIVNAAGKLHEVRGEGVVGLQPVIEPGSQFEYNSYCPLETPWGTMEGTYFVEVWEEGAEPGSEAEHVVEVAIGRFYLVSGD